MMKLFHIMVLSLAFVLEKSSLIQNFLNMNPYLHILEFSFNYFITVEFICLGRKTRYLTRCFSNCPRFQTFH